MKEKLKLHLIKFYVLEAGGQEQMTEADWNILGQGIEWRVEMVGRLVSQVKRGLVPEDNLLGLVGCLSIRRQIETEMLIYQQEINELGQLAAEGEVSREEFEDILVTLSTAIIILAFLLGSVESKDDFNEDQQLIYDSALTVLLSGAGNPRTQSPQAQAQFNTASAVLMSPFFLNNTFTPEQLAYLQIQMDFARDSGLALSLEIENGDFSGEDPLDLTARLALWIGTANASFSEGQMYRPDNPYFKWLVGIAEHCVTCLDLNNVVRTAQEWLQTPFRPRVKNGSLACGGWKCQCGFFLDLGPSRGRLPLPFGGVPV